MRKFILFIILAIIFGGFFFWSEILDFYSKLILRLPQVEERVALIQEVEKVEKRVVLIQEVERQIVTPPPLRAVEEAPEPTQVLTQAGVIKWTNFQREKYGLPPLKESPELNASAVMKAQNMLAKQYFGHLSPSGEGVADLVKIVGYQFIAIGENLALGNFETDETLVQAWMESPGHQANILSLKYQEIGAAVLQGEFEGKTTWLAVQHFGLPLTACPQPPKAILTKIEINQAQMKELEITLRELQLEIRRLRPKWGPIYSQKVEQYNNLVSQYNELLTQTEDLINQYNNQVILFNECAAGF